MGLLRFGFILSSTEKIVFENFLDNPEDCLTNLEEYPTIPAIEVTIPHILAS